MARQLEKPESGRPAASGFLHSRASSALDYKQINRGDYCHRHFICSEKKKIDILPADPDHFYRCRNNPDGLMYYCKPCHNEENCKSKAKNRAGKKGKRVKAGRRISGEVSHAQ